jgi:D-glycero-D-manno-heptose 1,7-bisphosphate phosphatase
MGKPGVLRKRFVVLDRDGTINVERHYLSDPDQVELIPGAVSGLNRMKKMGLGLVVITNQSGVGRGYFNAARLDLIHRRLRGLLEEEKVSLDGIYFCPHRPDEDCACRKPKPGLLLRSAEELNFDPHDCFFIGDKASDLELGRGVGGPTLLVRTGYGSQMDSQNMGLADFVVDDLCGAANVIGELLQGGNESQ